MGRIGQVLGLLLLVVGVSLAAWGAPYYMLDWGSTFVMAGIALASGGLSCLLVGTVLIRLSELRADILALRASSAISAVLSVSDLADAEPAPTEYAPDATGTARGALAGMSGGGVAAAGVAAGGLAVVAKSILTSVAPDEPIAGSVAEQITAPVDEGKAQSAGLTDGDRASLDDLLARLSLPLSDETKVNDPDAPLRDEPIAAPRLSAPDDLLARIDDAADVLKLEAKSSPELTSMAADWENAAQTLSPRAPTSMEQRIDDEFADLRAELASGSQGLADVRDEALLETSADLLPALDEQAGQQPSVHLPELAMAELHQDISGTVDDEHVEWVPASRPANGLAAQNAELADNELREPVTADAQQDQSTPDETETGEFEADAAQAAPVSPTAAEPASSSEGVVAAYNVGDASYAMFNDGRIRVSTPEGQFMLGSMDELKSFMSARRGAN